MRKSQYVIQQRQQDLLGLLARNGRMTVGELSEQLCVSDITVRRDLELLSRAGVVDRFHGGGMLPSSMLTPTPAYEEKARLHMAEKTCVAAAAAALVPDGATVTLNAGSTTLEVIRQLRNSPVRIVTNNAMASEVLQESRAELISTGGAYNEQTRAFTGEFTSHVLNKINADICFVGAGGVQATHGITSAIYKETFINELMVNRCRGRTVVVADSSKLGKTCCFLSMAMTRVQALITDAGADPHQLDPIRALGIEVIVAH